jgi:hypothetical protein
MLEALGYVILAIVMVACLSIIGQALDDGSGHE